VLSAERVEVSARSSNRTADSGVSTANAARHRPSAGRWPGSPPARSPAGQRVGQHCLRLVEDRHFRRVASVEPLSDQPCHFLGLHRLRSTGHLTTFSGEGRAAIHLPAGLDRPAPGPGWPAATPHDNWCMECTRRSTHLPLPEAGTDSPSCVHRRRFETGCRSAPFTVRDPSSGPASDRIAESVCPLIAGSVRDIKRRPASSARVIRAVFIGSRKLVLPWEPFRESNEARPGQAFSRPA